MRPVSLDELNALPDEAARGLLGECCSQEKWQALMSGRRPFRAPSALLEAAEACFDQLEPLELLSAFAGHPRIGQLEALGSGRRAGWSRVEQSGVRDASREILETLARSNRAYEEKFGFVFLICAAGLSAAELLSSLEQRSRNSAERELQIASAELRRITLNRLERLIHS
jgi:2-oxo-4-hydroxy-4-carboxy-5-ureidoimidazoline decarboxylase